MPPKYEIKFHRHSTDKTETKIVNAQSKDAAIKKMNDAIVGSFIILDIKEIKNK